MLDKLCYRWWMEKLKKISTIYGFSSMFLRHCRYMQESIIFVPQNFSPPPFQRMGSSIAAIIYPSQSNYHLQLISCPCLIHFWNELWVRFEILGWKPSDAEKIPRFLCDFTYWTSINGLVIVFSNCFAFWVSTFVACDTYWYLSQWGIVLRALSTMFSTFEFDMWVQSFALHAVGNNQSLIGKYLQLDSFLIPLKIGLLSVFDLILAMILQAPSLVEACSIES